MRKRLSTLLISILLVISCSSRDEQAVEKTVLRYNELLAKGYAELNMAGLGEVATENQIAKVYIHMAALGEGKVRMVSELKEMHIVDISFPTKDSAQATTKETWNYTHINIETNKVDKTIEGIVYRLSYELNRRDGLWFVTNVVSREEEKKKAAPDDTR